MPSVKRSFGARQLGNLRFVREKPLGTVGGLLVTAMAVVAMFAEWISPHDPLRFHYDAALVPPGWDFLLGTDHFGRDILSRVIFGARTSLFVGIGAVLLGEVGGGAIGLVSAYFGGKVDLITQRVVDVVMVFPSLVLALAIVAALGNSINNVIIAIAISMAPGTARTIRSAALSIKESQYVEAARVIGCSDMRIMFRHIWPNCISVLLIVASASLAHSILTEASLSFLGLGVPPPNPSWGAMMSGEGRRYLVLAPWIALSAGIAISLAVLGFNLLGDALRDIWDPRLRRR